MSKLREILEAITPRPNPYTLADAEAAIKDYILELIGDDSPHTPDAEAHFDTTEFKYPCCERVQAKNRLRAELRRRLEEK